MWNFNLCIKWVTLIQNLKISYFFLQQICWTQTLEFIRSSSVHLEICKVWIIIMLYLKVPKLLKAWCEVVCSAVQCTKKYAWIIPSISIKPTVTGNWNFTHLFERIYILRIELLHIWGESSWDNILEEKVSCVQDTSGFLFYKVSCAEYFGKLQFGITKIEIFRFILIFGFQILNS